MAGGRDVDKNGYPGKYYDKLLKKQAFEESVFFQIFLLELTNLILLFY